MERLTPDGPDAHFDENPHEITPAERMALITFSGSDMKRIVTKLLRIIVDESKEAAIEVDPANVEEQRAKTTLAHDQLALLHVFDERLTYIIAEKVAEIHTKVAEHQLKEAEVLEDVILYQADPVSHRMPI